MSEFFLSFFPISERWLGCLRRLCCARSIGFTVVQKRGIRHLFMFACVTRSGPFDMERNFFFILGCLYFSDAIFSQFFSRALRLAGGVFFFAETITLKVIYLLILDAAYCVVLFARADPWSFSFCEFQWKKNERKSAGKLRIGRSVDNSQRICPAEKRIVAFESESLTQIEKKKNNSTRRRAIFSKISVIRVDVCVLVCGRQWPSSTL